jgi:hypothetical protein
MNFDKSYFYETDDNLFKMLFLPETKETANFFLNLKVKELEYKLDLINEIFIKDFKDNKNIKYKKKKFDILYNETKLLFPDLLLHIKDYNYYDYDILCEKINKNINILVEENKETELLVEDDIGYSSDDE